MAHRQDEEAWKNRSTLSRDFVRCALQSNLTHRPSAAALLFHPWMRTVIVPRCDLGPAQAHTDVSVRLQGSIFCYVLCLLLLPALILKRDMDLLMESCRGRGILNDGLIA